MQNYPFYYVYILCNQAEPPRHYTGSTQNLRSRLQIHNTGECKHTAKFRPWHIETALSFRSRDKALAFEKYLKTGSGRAFAKRHF